MREKSADFSLLFILFRRCLPLSSALSACCRNSGLWLSRFCRCFRLVAVPVCRCPEFCRCSGFVPPAFCRSHGLPLFVAVPRSAAVLRLCCVPVRFVGRALSFPAGRACCRKQNSRSSLRRPGIHMFVRVAAGADCRRPVPRLAHGDLRGADQAAFAEELHGVGACGESGAVVEDAHVEVLILVVHFAHG